MIVHQRDEAVAKMMLPKSMLHYVLRTRQSVILDDAAAQSAFAKDRTSVSAGLGSYYACH